MKVNLKVYATLVRTLSARLRSRYPQGIKPGSSVELELPDGSTLATLLEELQLGDLDGHILLVGGKARRKDHVLADGDEVRLFPPVGGG